jgi:hypothetical protein
LIKFSETSGEGTFVFLKRAEKPPFNVREPLDSIPVLKDNE